MGGDPALWRQTDLGSQSAQSLQVLAWNRRVAVTLAGSLTSTGSVTPSGCSFWTSMASPKGAAGCDKGTLWPSSGQAVPHTYPQGLWSRPRVAL